MLDERFILIQMIRLFEDLIDRSDDEGKTQQLHETAFRKLKASSRQCKLHKQLAFLYVSRQE